MLRLSRSLVVPMGGKKKFRWFTSASDVVDEMITYARSNYRENYDQALDILRSGLSFQQTGIGAGRLYLAQAEVQSERNNWSEVSHLCRQAAAAASDCQPTTPQEVLMIAEIELAASLMGTRAFLTQNKDAEAFQMAQQSVEIARKSFTAANAEDHRWQGLVLSNSTAALVQHAAGDLEAAEESFQTVLTLADHLDERQGRLRPRDTLIPFALKQAAAFRTAQLHPKEALSLADRATKAAKAAFESSKNDATPLSSPLTTGEVLLDAHLQSAQACIDLAEWNDAEKHLSNALEVAESLSEGAPPPHARTALVLIPLAWVYSRTGRVTLAEGLYREITKMLGVSSMLKSSASPVVASAPLYPATDLGVASGAVSSTISSTVPALHTLSAVHPSINSLAAWRYAQLLSAMPKRTTETAAWHALAQELYDDAPLRRILEPSTVFGTLDTLQGKGDAGYGVVVDAMTRRVLPKEAPALVTGQQRES